ncbi:MAG: response regulator transcription factor [Pseudomonadota bacterium]
MLVEDDNSTRNGLIRALDTTRSLALSGSAGTFSKAAALIRTRQFDVLLLDLCLEGRSGLSLISLAKTEKPHAKVIVISVLGDEMNVMRAIRAGADGYLVKTASNQNIEKAIEDVLDGKPPLSPAVARYLLRSVQPEEPVQDPDVCELSTREMQVLRSLATGYTYREVADQYSLSYHTVVDYVRSMYRKLNVASRSEAVVTAVRQGIISLDA